MTTEATATMANSLATGALPLRQDDPISLIFIIKTMLAMALLLLVVYLVLRWYARRSLVTPSAESTNELYCVRELRLSARTRAYLIKADGQHLLVTESVTGVTVTALGKSDNQIGAAQ